MCNLKVFILLTVSFSINKVYGVRKSATEKAWDDSIHHCKNNGEELLTPLFITDHNLLTASVSTEAGHYWTSLEILTISTLGWEGITFYDTILPSQLPWKPGKRPTATDVGSCVAMEVTKLSVVFYPETCTVPLFSYCRSVDATTLFKSYVEPTYEVNATAPFMNLTGVVDSKACAYECMENGSCVTYTYISDTQQCQLFDVEKVEQHQNQTWTVKRCVPLTAPEHSNSMNNDRTAGSVVTIDCDYPYTSTDIQCQDTGRWTGIPKCTADMRDCSLGDLSHEGVCYRFSNSAKTWNEARMECEGHGGHLLEVKDSDKMDVVDKMLFFNGNGTFWTGASDEIKTDWWHWSTEYTEIDYSRWHTVSGDPTGHCVQLRRTWDTTDHGQFYFDDTDCNEERHSICEIGNLYVIDDFRCDDSSWCRGRSTCYFYRCRCTDPYSKRVGAVNSPNTVCQRNWMSHSGYNLVEIKDEVPQEIAMEACKRAGGSLLAPVTAMLDTALTQFYIGKYKNRGMYVWSSLKKTGNEYQDEGIQEFAELVEDYLPWREGFETDKYTPGNCVIIEVSKYGAKLFRAECDRSQGVLCAQVNFPVAATVEMSKSVSLEPMRSVWTLTSDWCGAECLTQPNCTSYGYIASNYTCHLFNGTATTGTTAIMDYWTKSGCAPITSVLDGNVTSGSGLTAVSSQVTYSCVNNYHNVTSLTVTCLANNVWSELPSCQPDDPSCPEKWARYGSSCYLIVETESTWSSAASACEDRNSYLAEINTEHERIFLVNFLDFDYNLVVWTGGNDIGLQHWYRWRQYPFTTMTVLDWYPGLGNYSKSEPTGYYRLSKDDPFIYEDCIKLMKVYDGNLADRHYYSDDECKVLEKFLCETKVLNVGSSGCGVYTESPCKGVAECTNNECRCPYDTYRQTGPDDWDNSTCNLIQPVGGRGCMSQDELCFNVSVCSGDRCVCPSPLVQNGQDNSYATECEIGETGCTGDWRGKGDKCYKMFTKSSLPGQITPDQDCVMVGGTLASPIDEELNDFLLFLGKRANKWISLHGREDVLKWADDTVFGVTNNFTNFREGTGEDLLLNETCVYLSMQGTWVKEACYPLIPTSFICAQPKSCPSPPNVTYSVHKVSEEYSPVGTVLEYECETGYVIDGLHSGRIMCKATTTSSGLSVWEPAPTCVPLIGSIFGVAPELYGEPVTPALTATDEASCSQMCYQQGEGCFAFSFSSPTCQLYTALAPVSTTGYIALPSPPTVTRKRTACPPLPIVNNTVMTGTDRSVGSTVTYTCTSIGRVTPGSHLTVKCQSNGFWEDLPECRDRFKLLEIAVKTLFTIPETRFYYNVPSLEDCEMKCVHETKFRCLSLHYSYGECFLYTGRIGNKSRKALAAPSNLTVYAEITESDLNEFHTLFNMKMTPVASDILTNKSMEDCAQACLLISTYNCLTMVYHVTDHTCSLYNTAVDIGVNTQQENGLYLFARHFECGGPPAPPGMTFTDVIRKVTGRYSVGDQIHYTCNVVGEDLAGDNPHGLVHCQQGGKWSRLPVCKNLCETGWYFKNGSCYRVYDDVKPFKMASSRCLSENASLINIEMAYEISFVNQIRQADSLSSSEFWLGVYSDLGKWTWTDRFVGNSEVLGISLLTLVDNSAMVADVSTGGLSVKLQTQSHRYVCKKALPNLRCPDGWYYFNQTCYYTSATDIASTYTDAEMACDSLGYTLATPHSHQTLDSINKTIELSGVTYFAYLGLRRQVNEDWKYVDGSTLDYRHSTGVPGLSLGESCFLAGPVSTVFDLCDVPRPYVCQAPLDVVGVATEYGNTPCVSDDFCQEEGLKCLGSTTGKVFHAPTCRPSTCPSGMQYERGRCFHISNETANYVEATASCGKMGGRLVSIGSLEENQAWLELAERQHGIITPIWVGYDSYLTTDRLKTNPLDSGFENWVAEQPAITNSPACVVQSGRWDGVGKWMGSHCISSYYHYICEVNVMSDRNTQSAYYQGCFLSAASPFPSVKKYLKTFPDLDVSKCRAHCTDIGYKYAAMERGKDCSCGNVLDMAKREIETNCLTNCAGNTGEKCGGTGYFSVYQTTENKCTTAMPTDPTHPVLCYTMSLANTSWWAGRYSCGRNGGDLVNIQSMDKQRFMFESVFTEPGSLGGNVAIGVYQKYDQKVFNYYTTDNMLADWKYYFKFWNLLGKEEDSGYLDCAVSNGITGEWKHGLCRSAINNANFACEYKENHPVPTAENIWRRMLLEVVDSTNPSAVLVNVSSQILSNKDKVTVFTHNTILYCNDLDLGCLNNRQLCPEGFTLMFMIFIENAVTSDLEVMSTGNCVSSFAVGQGVCIYYKASPSELTIRDATGNVSRSVRLSVVRDMWYHVTIVFDGSDNMYAYLDGDNGQVFADDAVDMLKHTVVYDAVLLGNWHHITTENDRFKLHDVRFKPQKMMWNEITNLYGELNLEAVAGSSNWLEDDFSHVLSRYTLPDPGVDGRGMKFSQHGAIAFLSDSGHTCVSRLDQCTGDFTVTFWINVQTSSSVTRNILAIGDVTGGKQGLQVNLQDDVVHIDLVLSSRQFSGNIGSLSFDQWHLITVEYKAMVSVTVCTDGNQVLTLSGSVPGISSVAPMSTFVIGHVMCPFGWVYAGTSCYHLEMTPASYWTHVRQSKTAGAHLIHVESNQELTFLDNFMDSNSVSTVVLAHHDEGPKGHQRFVRVPGGREDYFTDSFTNYIYRKLDCSLVNCTVQIMSDTELQPAVYEMELDKSEFPVQDGCPYGWKYFKQSCYKHMGSSLMSGVTALQKCQEVWAYPVDINSQEELRFVANLTYSQQHEPYSSSSIVGLSHETLFNGSEMYVRGDWSPTQWDSWEYKPPGGNLTCVKLQCDYGGCYYVDVLCTSMEAFAVCERDAGPRCGPGWIESGGQCYYKHSGNVSVSADFCQLAGYSAVVVQDVNHVERLLYDLDIGDAVCLTDAVLTGTNYTWASTGQVTYFDKDITVKTETCVSLTGQTASRGLTPTCTADCIICQHDVTPVFSVDNIRFYETALTATEISQLYDEGDLTPHRLSCPMTTANMVSTTSINCEMTEDTSVTQVTLTGSGAVTVVSDTMDREALTLGSGLAGTFTGTWLDVTSAKRGFTIAFWVYVSEDSESVLIDSNNSGNNGVKITYTNRTLAVEVTEPNYLWSTWIWFPVQDWTYVTLTWHETLGLALFINADCMSRKEFGVARDGYNTVVGASTVLKIAQHLSGSEVMIKDFIHDNGIWSEDQIKTSFDAPSMKYSITFDQEYRPNWDNLPMNRNDSVTSFVWRNSFFLHSLYVNNPTGDITLPAAISVGQMRSCFTRMESSKSPLTISFWLRPIDYRNPQTYISAYTPSPMGAPRSVSWEVIYNNTADQFNFKIGYKKIGYTFPFSLDFMQWSHIHLAATQEVKLFVNGVEQTAPTIEHLPSYIHPVQPFSYLEIGTVGHFEIDDIQFYAAYKEPSELYLLRSCHEYRLAGFRGKRDLQVGLNETDINTVNCEFTTGPYSDGVTLVSHDKQGNQPVPATGGTTQFTYTASTAYLQLLRDESLYCSQRAEYYCTDRALFGTPGQPVNFWTSLDSSTHNYWAGGDQTVPYSCSCNGDNSCQGGALCNCDSGIVDGVTRQDEGFFSTREHLPIVSVTLGPGSGSAQMNLRDFACVSIGYNGFQVTFEEDNNETLTSRGITLDFTTSTHTYEEGISETALRLDNCGFTLSGTNARCLKDLTYCKFGFTFLIWLKIDDVTNNLQIFELGGQPLSSFPGLTLTCEAIGGDSERVSCVAEASGGTNASWTSQFLLQKKRWMHVGITWNLHLGLKVYLNGHELSDLGVTSTLTNGAVLSPLTTFSDPKVGYSSAFTDVGVWTVDNLWLVERDLSISEVRKHFGQEPGCVDGWVYNNVTGLCYNMTEGNPLLSHDEAETYCNSHGGTLATEFNSSTHDWLVNNVLDPSGVISYVHIGLAKTGKDGSYRWSDGRLVDHLPLLTETGGITSYCVVLEQTSWLYKSVDCHYSVGALCQKQPLWLPNKEISIGKENPTFNYTTLSTVNSVSHVEGVVGDTANFTLNYAKAEYSEECFNNIRLCHNGWSLSTWLYLTPADSSNREVLYSAQLPTNSYGVAVYGQQDGDYYYINVAVDDGRNETRTRFEISTYAWVHVYLSVSLNTSDITVIVNGQNNTYIQNERSEGSGNPPTVGTFVPFSVGANSEGGEQLVGSLDEFEVFEHELLDLETVLQEVSVDHAGFSQIEQNFDFIDMLKLDPTTDILPGKFGYALYLQADNTVTDKGQFAFDCFGSVDRCLNGFTVRMWIQPQINESDSDFGILSSINSHRGFMISYHSSHPVFTSSPPSYWMTVRDGATEYNFSFDIGDWFWSHILLTWRGGSPVLFVNGYKVTDMNTRTLSGDSYPVNLLHFGKSDDRVTSLEGFSGGVDEFLFWPQSLTDTMAVKLYLQTVYVERPFYWNTSVSGLPGNSVTLTDVSDYLNLTSLVVGGSCYLQGGSCHHGMTFSIIFQFLGLNDHDQTIVTAGGDIGDGTGMYFRVVPNNASMPFRRYFQFGVRTDDKEYSVFFHLRYSEWTQVIAEFHPRHSLKIYVDKQFVGEDPGKVRTTSASGADRRLLVGKASVEVTEKPNFEIQQINLWDKHVDASVSGQVEDYMHFVHREIGRVNATVAIDISLADCYSLCSEDNITECNSFSFCPRVKRGDCYLLLDEVTESSLIYTDQCDAFIPVKMPYLDYFQSCISDTAITSLTKTANVNNWEQCRRTCRSASSQYAGVFNGTDCYCDESLGEQTAIPTSNCDIDCSTTDTETCGGVDALSVYDTGNWQPFLAPTIVISLLEVTAHPGLVVGIGDVINLTMEVNDNTSAGYFISTQAMAEDFYTGFNTTEITVTRSGTYTLTVRAMNEISFRDYVTEVFVFVPLSDLSKSYQTVAKTAEVVTFTATVSNGTNITCEISYGDGNHDSLYQVDDSMPFSFTHGFSNADVYNINITCYNNISTITDEGYIIIQDVITNLQMTTDSPVQHPDPLSLTWSINSGTNVTFLLMIDGINTNLEIYVSGSLSGSAILPQSLYNWTGQHNLVLKASNLVSQAYFNTSVIIEIPIDIVAITSNGTYHIVGVPVKFTVTIAKGSNLTIWLQLDDATNVELTSTSNSVNHVISYHHSYSYFGQFEVNLTVSNIHGIVGSFCTVITEVSVADVVISADDIFNPVDYELQVLFEVSSASQIPTNALINIGFGDTSSVSSVESLMPGLYQNITHNYSTHGVFLVAITIHNNVSTKSLNRNVKVGGPIANFSVAINRMFIPIGSPLITTANVQYGSLITYHYNFGDGNTLTQPYTKSYPAAEDIVSHTYNNTLDYEVNITASNSFNSASKNLTIHVQERVEGLILTSDAPVRVNSTMTFYLTMVSAGTDTCFVWDFSDGTKMLFGVPSCPFRPEYVNLDFEPMTGQVLTVTHAYDLEGSYNVSINSSNEVSWDFVALTVSALEYLCIEPEVEILGLTKNGITPVTMKRSKRFKISANIDTQCVPPVDTIYEWLIEEVSVSGNTSHQNVLFIREIVPPTNGLPSMTIPGKYLDYGHYKISLTVSYATGSSLNTTDFSFIKIVPSQLFVSIKGDYYRTVYVGNDLALNSSASFDPDFNNGTMKGLMYKWYCRLDSETFLLDANGFPLDVLSNTSSGCFGNGFGFLGQISESLVISSSDLVTSQLYVFVLVISKDNRVSQMEQRIQTVGTPVTPISIRCVDNCGIKTCRNQPLRLQSVCDGCSSADKLALPYTWQLFVIHPGNVYQEVNLTSWTLTEENENNTYESGFTDLNLMIIHNHLIPGFDYRIRLTSNALITEKQLTINYPPYGGQCSTNRQLGMEFETKFVISCENWLDEADRPMPNPLQDKLYEEPITFKMAYQVRGSGSHPHVFYEVTGTRINTPELLLRSGLEEHQHMVDIIICVSDSGGAYNVTKLSVKVIQHPQFVTEVFNSVNYQRLEAEKDITGILLVNMGVIERLNELKNKTNGSTIVTVQMTESVIHHVAEHADWIETPAQVELVVDILDAVMDEPKQLSRDTRTQALSMYRTLLQSLDSIFNESSDSVTQQKVSKAMMGSFIELMLANAFTSNCASTNCRNNRELADDTQSVFESRGSVVRLMLKGAVAGEPPVIVSSKNGDLTYQIQRLLTSKLTNSSLRIKSKEAVEFPDITKKISLETSDLEMMESPKLQIDADDVVQSRTMAVSLFNKGETINLTDLNDLIKVTAHCSNDLVTHTIDVAENFTSEPYYIEISLERSDVTVVVELEPENDVNATFDYVVSYNTVPTEDSNEVNGTLPLVDESEADEQWTLVFDVASFSSDETEKKKNSEKTPAVYLGLLPLHNISTTSSVVNVTIFTAGCQYWDIKSRGWKNNGLTFGKKTNKKKVECLTNHLTSFGASFFVPPNTINFQTVFSKFSDISNNAAVFATVIAVIGLYIIIVFFVRRADKKDVVKWSVLPLLDNLPSDVYHYQVTVFTGMRRNAGTKSRVFFVLGGEDGDTEIRAIEAESKMNHERGSVNSYILSVPQTLGHLLFMRIWHDNSGKGIDSDWYLSLILVKDLQIDKKYVFLCDRWLAVDKDDGELERFLPVSTKEDLESFGHLFGFKARQDLTDGHLWFSVASRPTWSNFTRVQRLSCCLSLLFTTMVANAMWYGVTPSEGTQDVHLGPFTFSPQELTTSLMMSLIVVPINLLIVTLFRKAGPKPAKKSKKNFSNVEDESSADLPRTLTPSGIFTIEAPQKDFHDSQNGGKIVTRSSKPRKSCCLCPYWVAYIAWFLVLVSIVAPAFFTILYSLEWGADKSSRWLTSFVLSFVESVVLVQPIKVLAVALVIALIFKKLDFGEEAPAEEQEGETIVYSEPGRGQYGNYAHPLKPAHRRPYVEKPPDFSTIDNVRKYRKKQNRMVDIIKEVGTYVFYLIIVAIICYENRDENSFRIVNNIRNLMVKDINLVGASSAVRGFDGVSSFDHFWDWSIDRLLPALYVQNDFNGDSVPSDRLSLLSDHVNYRVGPPRLRQARVLTDTCKTQAPLDMLIKTCIAEYGVTNFEDESYDVGWTPLNTSTASSNPGPWHYQSVIELGGIPAAGDFGTYGGGGYVAVLGNDNTTAETMLMYLKDNKWIDRQTRAVFLELNLYNPYVNLFCAVSLLLEIPPTGSAISYTHITPLRLYRYVGPSALFMIVTDLIFVAFTLYFLVRLVKEIKAKGRKYLHHFWNFIELLNVTAAILCCAFYGVHYVMTAFTLNNFHSSPGEFVNFQSIVLWDEVFAFMQGFLLFFSMIKLLRLIRFNAKITQLSTTLRKAVGPIFNFFIVFFLVFMSFTQFAYLVFGPVSSEYFSFLTSLETLFSMLLMKVNIEQVMVANSVLGPLFLFLFILVVVFILLNMLLSILNEVFTQVRLDKRCRPDDPEMVDFMINELKRVVGITEMAKGVKKKTPKNDSKVRPCAMPNDVERWLAEENDRFSPESLDDEEYQKAVPPTSTDLDLKDLSKRECYMKQSKDWLKALRLPNHYEKN